MHTGCLMKQTHKCYNDCYYYCWEEPPRSEFIYFFFFKIRVYKIPLPRDYEGLSFGGLSEADPKTDFHAK